MPVTKRDPLALVTVAELSELLKVSRYWIYEQINAGRLPALKMGEGRRQWRFRRKDIDAFLKAHSQ